ncbi:alkylhydroperoxidase AhpD family core domain-containing protein [Fodinibius sediminis]|uniref:Alkylhydroperoxidase AhpD family core domain-containing protein n=2 Tax=Fodinibius sediminis TaxID=1214077 RepID=A0A521BGL9_9BACT|nr:alkylhydroperoxidase AhpD family core domain-containing protein [Fodinibius sediminis]
MMNPLLQMVSYLKSSGLDPKLLELVNYRVSQINGCAYCLEMHYKEALANDEDALRLHSLPAFRECPFYTDKEKVVLEYAEILTKVASHEVKDSLVDRLKSFYSDSEIGDLTLAITLINSFNRINIAFLPTLGQYEAG